MKRFNMVSNSQSTSFENNTPARSMLPKHNIATSLTTAAARMLLIGALLTGLTAGPSAVGAQALDAGTTGVSDDTAKAVQQLQAPLVDWSHALHVYKMAEGWLREGDAGQPLAGDDIQVTGLSGVRVTLRWLGLRMGTGQASFDAAPASPGKVMNLTEMTRTAVRGAMLQVNDKLREAAKRGANSPAENQDKTAGQNDTTGPRTIADLQGMLLMDIQIAGRLQPIRIDGNAPAATLYHRFAPGYNGLRLTTRATDGTPLASWLWPADSIASGLSPHGQILQLMAGVGIKIGKENTIARPDGPSLESFEVIHMVRPAINQPITRLIRGNVLLPPTSVDARTLDDMTTRIAAHLRSRQLTNGQFPGTYLPSSDRNLAQQSSTSDGALACYALSRWVNSGTQSPSSKDVADTQMVIRKWLDANLPAMLAPDANTSPAALALGLLTLSTNPALADLQQKRDQLAQALMNLRHDDGSFHVTTDPKAPQVDVPVGALIVDSLAAFYLATHSTRVGEALPATMTWVWDRTDPLRSIGALPWLLQADAQLETLTNAQGENALNPRGARAARLARLLPTIEIITSKQIIAPPAAGPADVIGGFELGETDPASPPNPDWRTAHMLMVISQSLRNADLAVGRNRVEGLLTCGRAARFIAQLMFDEPGAYYVRNPATVIGGVRPILWDNRLDLAPSAMSLLATCDLRETLAQWAKHQQ